MKRYYEKHKCEECGCYYMAFGPTSRHCPDCLRAEERCCKKCGVAYKPKTLDSEYCGKHRFLQSPAYLAKYAKRQGTADPEANRLAKNARNARYRQSKKVDKPVVVKPVIQAKVEKKRVETMVQTVFRSAPEAKPLLKVPEKPVDKFFLRTGPKTLYGFTTQERLESFKKRNGIA